MKLGKDSRYAIEGLIVLAGERSGTIMMLRDIAEKADVPPKFLAKIFQKLKRAKLLESSRGAVRGYALARHAKSINVRDVIFAVEGSDVFDRCLFWSDRCADQNPCPMHFDWQRLRQATAEMMEQLSLAQLAKRKARDSYLRKSSNERSSGGILG